MKYLKHILLCCSFFILLLCLIPAQAQASKYTYNIEKYNVSIRVTPQNTYEITEKLTVNFKTEHHGIYRRIPLENEVGRDDGAVLPYTPGSLTLTVEKMTILQAGKTIILSSRSATRTLH